MKSHRLIVLIIAFMTSALYINAEIINLTGLTNSITAFESDYTNNMNRVWMINAGVQKPIVVELNFDLEYGCDFLFVYSVNNNNEEQLIGTYTGTDGGIYVNTIIPSGKAKVVLTSDGSSSNDDGYWGVESYYSVDESFTASTSQSSIVNQSLYVTGNSYLQGNVGIGTYYPNSKLDIKGDLQLGTSAKLKLSNWSGGQGGWIDMPISSGIPSGIGSGGIGSNAWIAYAGNANQWFNGAAAGDICYRNMNGRLLFGNGVGTPAVTIKNNNVGVGIINPTRILQVSKSDISTNQSLSNTSSLELWNPNGGLNTGSQINFRSDVSTTNSGIGAVIGYLNKGSNSTGSIGNLVFSVKNGQAETSVNPAMTIQYGGNVGIGTILPNAKLQIGNSYSDAGNPVMRIAAAPSGTNGVVTDALHIDSHDGPNFAQGIAISMGLQTTTYGEYTSRIIHFGNTGSTRASKLQLQTHSVNQGVWNTGLLIDEIGYVGIGTTKPTHLLSVNGTIRAKEVIVDLCTDLADYVFNSDYELMPLVDVEKYVKENKHLPEIPSATEVQKNGLSVGEMQNKLLQKIEELTLYVIEQQKQIDELKKELKK